MKHFESVLKQQFLDCIFIPRGGWPWTQYDLALFFTADRQKYRGDTME